MAGRTAVKALTSRSARGADADRQLGPSSRHILFVGLLLGLAAALHGVAGFGGVRPWHILVALAFVSAVVSAGAARVKAYRLTWIDGLFLLSIAANIAVEWIQGTELNYPPNLLSAATDLFYFGGFVTARLLIRDRQDLAFLLKGLIWPIFPTAIVALLQTLAVGPVLSFVFAVTSSDNLEARLESGRVLRGGAFIGHWTALGFYLNGVLAATMVLLALYQSGARASSQRFIVAAIIAGFAGVLSTLTLSAIGAAAVIVLVGLTVSGIRLRMLLGSAGALLILSIVLADPLQERWELQYGDTQRRFDGVLGALVPNTLLYRINIWATETLPAISERPWLGWGIGIYDLDNSSRIYPSTLRWASPESQWLGSLMWGGIIGSAAFFLLLSAVLLLLLRRLNGDMGPLVRPVLAMYVLAILAAFTAPVFTSRGLAPVLWPLIGALVALSLSKHDHRLSAQAIPDGAVPGALAKRTVSRSQRRQNSGPPDPSSGSEKGQ